MLCHAANRCHLIASCSTNLAARGLLHNIGKVYPLIPSTVSVLSGLGLGYRDMRNN